MSPTAEFNNTTSSVDDNLFQTSSDSLTHSHFESSRDIEPLTNYYSTMFSDTMTSSSDSIVSADFLTNVYSTDSTTTTPVSLSDSKSDDPKSYPNITTLSPDVPYSFETTDSLLTEYRYRKISNYFKNRKEFIKIPKFI